MAAIIGKIVFAVTAGAMLSGCSASGTSTPSAPPGPTRSSPSPFSANPSTPAEPARAGVPKCVAADVQGVFGKPDQAAGVHGVQIIVTNTSTHTCRIFGYGGLEMFSGGDGRSANITLNRLPQPGPTLVTLEPGGKASKDLSWTAPNTPVGNPDQCTAFIGFAEVILPDDTRAFTVDGDLGQVCGNRIVDGSAYSAGSTS